jgi:hypothetical protein
VGGRKRSSGKGVREDRVSTVGQLLDRMCSCLRRILPVIEDMQRFDYAGHGDGGRLVPGAV